MLAQIIVSVRAIVVVRRRDELKQQPPDFHIYL